MKHHIFQENTHIGQEVQIDDWNVEEELQIQMVQKEQSNYPLGGAEGGTTVASFAGLWQTDSVEVFSGCGRSKTGR